MPLPVASCVANVPSDVCCDTVWLMGERIRTVALAAVCACLDESCRSRPMESWQTEGERSGSVKGDSLVVSFTGLDSSVRERTRRGSPIPTPITRADFRVELRESGWPMIAEHSSTQTVKLPDPQMVHALAKHARGHAEAMWRALLRGATSTVAADQLFPAATNPHIINRGVAISQLSGSPSGPQITYSLNISVDHVLP